MVRLTVKIESLVRKSLKNLDVSASYEKPYRGFESFSLLVARLEAAAEARGFSVRRMPSGAGHDAQMFALNCPTAMVFVPSRGGLSHNIAEHTEPAHLVAGAQVLLDVALDLLGDADSGDRRMALIPPEPVSRIAVSSS